MDKLNTIKNPTKNIITDAGYGSEENYDYITRNNIGNYVKYNNLDYEKTKAYRDNDFISDHFVYDRKNNQYVCPSGQKLEFALTKKNITDNGYQSERMVYRSVCCEGCKYREKCCKGQRNRCIELSPKLIEYKNIARKNLESAKGQELRYQRGVDVESVFE